MSAAEGRFVAGTDVAVTPARRRLALGTLFAVATLSLLDRHILYVLQEPIKHELALSDAQLGAVGGLAFAMVYCVAAFPIARLADSGIRTRIVAVSVLFWSVMTALSGGAGRFLTLVVCRMGVAGGEAGSVPASHSLISDYYPPRKRSIAFALWSLSQPLGVMLAYLMGGWLAYHLGWRGTLVALGLVGIALVPLILLLKEPRRGHYDLTPPAARLSPREVAKVLYATRPLRFLLIAGAAHCVILVAVQSWSAPFYARAFAMPIESVAFYLAVVIGLAGGIGTFVGGLLVKRLGSSDRRWYMWLPALADLAMIPVVATQFLTRDLRLSLSAGFLGVFLLSQFQVAILVTAQSIVAANLRATVTASLQFVINITAVAIGPVVIGAVSDRLAGSYGLAQDSLRYAVLSSLILAPLATWFFYRAGATLGEAEGSCGLGR